MNTRWQSPQRTASPDGLALQASGSAAGTAHHVHRTIRVAIGEVARRGHVPTNAAEIAKAPRLEEEDIGPYTIEEARGFGALRPLWAPRGRSTQD
ncbi:hypothetical protein GCM10022255_071200 [Dactylosporangium darangshiense]|uniref:Uncharacterized protein n=1 Tax=Dactylosporangium darangshiense TaxID=579108 RepID=A0ABP8DID3_9ACTN